MRIGARWARWAGSAAALAVVTAGTVAGAGPGMADTRTGDPTIPLTVSADALPTVQVDGVVWSQAVVGNRVYAGGNFATARPAGAAAGTRTVKRTSLLAYDIRTGVLVPTFAPVLNGQVLAVAASPDGKRLYVAGSFTQVNGKRRYRLAAFDTATGALVTSFHPALDQRARALAVTNTTVYAGGAFTTAAGVRRPRLAAFRASTGALTTWAPAADAEVLALVRDPDGRSLVAGGRFTTVSGHHAYGLAGLDAASGAVRSFAALSVIRDAGPNSAITSLTTDGTLIYGTGYVYGAGGNFEGTFAARPSTGALVWLEDCHGDTYAAAPVGPVVYTVGHAHYCGNVGGFPESTPRSWQRALAFSTAAAGTVAHNTVGPYADFGGKPSPRLLTWWPTIAAGTFTGQSQGAWSVAATGSYVVLGGEFPSVNGKAQQGLVRFAVRTLAPNRQGPVASATQLGLTATAVAPGQVRLQWNTTWDRDNEKLTYTVTRTGTTAPVSTQTARTRFWEQATMGATDSGLPAGTYTYRLTVTDYFGNTRAAYPATVTVTG